MLEAIHTINILLPILYGATFAIYLFDFRSDKQTFHNSKRIFLFVTLLLHAIYLISRSVEFNHPPITNKNEIFTVLAFSIAFSYFVLELLSDVRGTGLFILIFPLLFQLLSSFMIQDLLEVKEVLRNRLLGMHVISALLGYSGFTMAAVYGVLFSMLYKELKLNRFGLIFDRLPSLETLEKLSFYSVVIGFVLLSVAILIGFAWLPAAFPDFSYTDPKLITTITVWLIFGVGILMKLTSTWYGRRVINFYLAGYIFAMVSMFLSNYFASSFHTFY